MFRWHWNLVQAKICMYFLLQNAYPCDQNVTLTKTVNIQYYITYYVMWTKKFPWWTVLGMPIVNEDDLPKPLWSMFRLTSKRFWLLLRFPIMKIVTVHFRTNLNPPTFTDTHHHGDNFYIPFDFSPLAHLAFLEYWVPSLFTGDNSYIYSTFVDEYLSNSIKNMIQTSHNVCLYIMSKTLVPIYQVHNMRA